MGQLPKISIVTPSFNDAQFLEATIRSVFDQNYPNLEYVIIDGGSTDGSIDIIRRYESRLAYWVSEKDNGMYHAIQKGFSKTTGEIMGWINSDDLMHNHCFSTLSQIFSDYRDVEWVQGSPNVIDENGRIISAYSWPELDKLYFYKSNREVMKYIQQESTFWRRSLWEKAGSHVNSEFKLAGDFELWMRFFQHAKLYNVPAFLGSFRVSRAGQGSIEHFNTYLDETRRALKMYPLTSVERGLLQRMRIADFMKNGFEKFFRAFKAALGVSFSSSRGAEIYFDRLTQTFKVRQ